MELELKMAKTRFIPGESLGAELIISNPASSAVSVPEVADSRNEILSYQLSGPSFAKDLVAHYGMAGGRRPAGDPPLVSIPAGGDESTNLEFDKYATTWTPGTHTLRAVMRWEGKQITSNVLTFDIQKADALSAQLIAEAGVNTSAGMRAVVLAATDSDRRLYQGVFREARPGLESPPERYFVEVFPVPTATSVAALWTNFDRRSAMVSPRYVWQRDQAVGVQEVQASPIMFDVGEGHLVRPAVMTSDAMAHFVSWHGARVTLTQVPRTGTPATVWETVLPMPAAGGRAWITRDNLMTAVFAAEQSGVVYLFLVQAGRVIANTTVTDAALLPQSEPGLWIAADGTIRASLLVADPQRLRHVTLVDWTWTATAATTAPTRQPAATLAQDAKAAAVTYALSGGTPRRDWVILCGDAIVVTNRSPNKPRMLSDAPMLPLQVLTTEPMSFLLLKHPTKLVYLTSLY